MPLEMRQTRSLAQSLEVAEDVRAAFDPLLPDLMRFYYGGASELDDEALFFEVEKAFGARLTREVCEPLGFYRGGCCFVALILMRQYDRRKSVQQHDPERRKSRMIPPPKLGLADIVTRTAFWRH